MDTLINFIFVKKCASSIDQHKMKTLLKASCSNVNVCQNSSFYKVVNKFSTKGHNSLLFHFLVVYLLVRNVIPHMQVTHADAPLRSAIARGTNSHIYKDLISSNYYKRQLLHYLRHGQKISN